jgi:hypothetical protein
MSQPIDLAQRLASLSEPWSPETVALMNDYDIRVVKTRGEFVPKGVKHQPFSEAGAEVVLIEPSETVNTGDTPSHLTAERRADTVAR